MSTSVLSFGKQPIPALLDKRFPIVLPQLKAIDYKEGVIVINDEKGTDVLDKDFHYVNMKH